MAGLLVVVDVVVDAAGPLVVVDDVVEAAGPLVVVDVVVDAASEGASPRHPGSFERSSSRGRSLNVAQYVRPTASHATAVPVSGLHASS